MKTLQINQIDRDISVAPQIVASDIITIANAGFKTIICNRPDGEGSDQQSFADIETAARASDISIIYQPVDGKNVSDEDGVEFGKLLDLAVKPVLAYCRTGTRCTVLWCLSKSGELPAKEIISMAATAGYDVSGITTRLSSQVQSG